MNCIHSHKMMPYLMLCWIACFVSLSSAAELKVAPTGAPFSTIQDAVDAAAPFDHVLVAQGVYSQVNSRPAPADYTGAPLVYQVVYIDKSIGLFGGYDATFSTRNPTLYPTVINGLNQGRCIFVDKDGDSTIDGFTIQNGNSQTLGGALWGDAGGGIFVHESSPVIISCEIIQCSSDNGAGVFFSYSPFFNLLHSTIKSNNAVNAGGAYLHSSRGVIIGSHFEANHADNLGGAMYISYQTPEISDSTFLSNNATGAGGSILLYHSGADITNCHISDSYGGKGGGIVSYSSTGTLDKNSIIQNTSQNHGGGLYLESCSHSLINNFVCDNFLVNPAGKGSGILSDGGSILLLHNTLANNSGGDGSGVHLTDLTGSAAHAGIVNQITSGHTTGVFVAAGSSATMDHTLWYDNTRDWDGAGTITPGTVAYFGDPLFVDPAGGDYHIQTGSPAVDVGTDTGIREDIDSHVRPWDNGFDIGADELRYVPKKGIWLNLPLMIHPGDVFFLDGYLENDGADINDVTVFFILDILGEFWFWPNWSQYDPATSSGIDFQVRDVKSGSTRIWVINPFPWPDTEDAAMTGLRFWGAMVDPASMSIIGDYAVVSWGFGP